MSHNELGLIFIPLPALRVQRETVERIQQQNAKQNRLRTAIEFQIATLTTCGKSLIHECVTGRRRITEADLRHSQLSEKAGQLNQEPSEEIGQLKTKSRGARTTLEYAILANEIMQGAFGLKVEEYKRVKDLERENLQDHMTDIELIPPMLAENRAGRHEVHAYHWRNWAEPGRR